MATPPREYYSTKQATASLQRGRKLLKLALFYLPNGLPCRPLASGLSVVLQEALT